MPIQLNLSENNQEITKRY